MGDDDGTEICPDYHTCRNNAQCVESSIREGSFYCDCDTIDEYDKVYAGVSCEHQVTNFCNDLNEKSYTSFCTNGGTCEALGGVADAHKGCKCPSPYTGDFCEFLVTQNIPDHIASEIGSPSAASASNGGSSSNGGTIAIVVVSLVLVLGIAATLITFFWVQHKKKSKSVSSGPLPETPPKSTSSSGLAHHSIDRHALQLEADGAVLQSAMSGDKNVYVDEEDGPRPVDPTFAIDETDASTTGSETGVGKII